MTGTTATARPRRCLGRARGVPCSKRAACPRARRHAAPLCVPGWQSAAGSLQAPCRLNKISETMRGIRDLFRYEGRALFDVQQSLSASIILSMCLAQAPGSVTQCKVQSITTSTQASYPLCLLKDLITTHALQESQARSGTAGSGQPASTTVDKRSGIITVGDSVEPQVGLSCICSTHWLGAPSS